jgi:hypothetical protein
MKNWIAFTGICVIAGLLMTPLTYADTTPKCADNITNPLQALAGSWTFSIEGFDVSAQPFAAAGRFVATIARDRGGNLAGVLNALQTVSTNGQINRLATGSGRFQVSPDCSGGVLMFPGLNREFDFFFVNPCTKLFFVSNDSGVVIGGTAERSSDDVQNCMHDMSDPKSCDSVDSHCKDGDASCMRQYSRCVTKCSSGPVCCVTH